MRSVSIIHKRHLATSTEFKFGMQSFQSSGKQKSAFITGITGQDGSYLAELLIQKGYQVVGLVRRSSTPNLENIKHLLESPFLNLRWGDLSDSSALSRIIAEVQPDEIYNLAAQSDVKVSFATPEYTGDVTGMGALRLLEAIRNFSPHSKFYQASSSEMFGKVEETPQTEATPFHPRSPYGVAKVYAFEITRNYRESYGLFALNGILFNHESPRRGENFVTRKITKAVGRIAAGQQNTLELGNLDAQRDWGFAGDYVDAMWRMLQADSPEDYVIATGETHSVRRFCELAFSHAELPITWEGEGSESVGIGPDGQILIQVNPQYFRPAEVDFLLGDSSKAKTNLGWEPKVSFEELVGMMVDADRVADS